VAEGIALVGVFIMIALLERWVLMHDRDPNGRTRGLFALREAKDAPAEKSAAPAGAVVNPPGPMRPPPARDTSLR
jgi:hypothetical protein